MPAPRHTFSKEERLCSQKTIQSLFSRKGTVSFLQYPLLGIWQLSGEGGEKPKGTEEISEMAFQSSAPPAQVLFSIAVKKIRKAHDRNRLRRQLKEIYRHKKIFLYESLSSQRLQCAIVILYIAQEKLTFQQLENALEGILKKIANAGR
jgi:ribonuclease P protein component